MRTNIIPIVNDNGAWHASPCASCASSPCCNNLPLAAVSVDSREDFGQLYPVVASNELLVGLKDDGKWTIFYRRSCRYYDAVTTRCTIHGRQTQPTICKNYSPHTCWYRRVFGTSEGPEMIWIDTARLRALEAAVGFDDSGRIFGVPSWEELCGIAASAGVTQPPAATIERRGEAAPSYFIFPPGRPRRASHLDLLRFRLGFPGVVLVVTDAEWAYAVETSVAPPPGSRYAVESLLGEGKDAGYAVVSLEHLEMLTRLFEIDESGTIIGWPSVGEVASLYSNAAPEGDPPARRRA